MSDRLEFKYLLLSLPIRDTIISGQEAGKEASEVEEAKGSGGLNIQNRCLFFVSNFTNLFSKFTL